MFQRCRVHQVDGRDLIRCSWGCWEKFPFLFFVRTAPGVQLWILAPPSVCRSPEGIFWEVWGLLPVFSRCSIGVIPHVDVFLMYLWGGRWSPPLTPPPSWRSLCWYYQCWVGMKRQSAKIWTILARFGVSVEKLPLPGLTAIAQENSAVIPPRVECTSEEDV